MGVVCTAAIFQNIIVWRKTGNTLTLVQSPMYIFVIGSFGYLFLAMQKQMSINDGIIFYILFALAFPILIIWAEEFTRRMEVISSTGDFELGLPVPSQSYQLLGAMGQLIQELGKPIVAVQGPSRINQKLSELAEKEPALNYMKEGIDGSFFIDPQIVPMFQISDSIKETLVILVDFLVQESMSITGRIPKKEFETLLKRRVANIMEKYSDLFINSGLLDRLAGGIFSDKISSGITDFDLSIGGGYPKQSAILLCGPPSDERNLILDSFMGTGLAKGDSCLYVTSAQPPENVQRQFGELSKDLVIVDCYTNRIQEVDTISRVGNVITTPIEMSVVSVAISRALDEEPDKVKRAVVDILPTYLVFQTIEKMYLDLMEIIDDFRKGGYTVIFSLNPYYMKDEGAISTLEEIFDGLIYVERTADSSGMKDEISLRIDKMAGQSLQMSTFKVAKPTKPAWQETEYSTGIGNYARRRPPPVEA